MKSYYLRNFVYHFLLSLMFLIHTNASGEKFELNNVTSIKIKNFSGTIELHQAKGLHRFNLKGNIFFTNKNRDIILEGNVSEEYSQNKNVLKIYGPSVPLSVFMQIGNINLKKWKKNVFISAQQAKIKAENTKGDWNLSVKKLSLNLVKHEGALNIKSFEFNAYVQKVKGSIDLQFNEGKFKARKSKIPLLRFATHKGSINISKQEGDLIGFSQEGIIRLSYFTSKNVKVDSDEGSIYFLKSKKSIRVVAKSEDGKIYTPKHFNKVISGKAQQVKGWLSGSRGQSRAHLNTKSGTIYIQ